MHYSAPVTRTRSPAAPPRHAGPVGSPDRSPSLQAVIATVEDQLRAGARYLMSQAKVSQAVLAHGLEVSQSSVSHMLTDRSYGLTCTEVSLIEKLCRVPGGTLYRQIGLMETPSVEKQIYDIPGIEPQAAEALVAAVQAVKANILRKGGQV